MKRFICSSTNHASGMTQVCFAVIGQKNPKTTRRIRKCLCRYVEVAPDSGYGSDKYGRTNKRKCNTREWNG